MTTFYLIRHGRTDWNDAGRYQGQADPPLNPLGLRQAEAAALALCGVQWTAICSSDLQRSKQTADALAARTHLPVRLDPRLREIHLGEWQGMQADEIGKRYAETFSHWHDAPTEVHAPGGEAVCALRARLGHALDDLAGVFPGGTVAVFTHKIPIALVRCRLHRRPLNELWHWLPENATWEIVDWPLAPAGAPSIEREAHPHGAH